MSHFFHDRLQNAPEESILVTLFLNEYSDAKLKDLQLIEIGYEDVNFAVQTDQGRYFLKVFSDHRDDTQFQRYNTIFGAIKKSNISVPKLYSNKNGKIISSINTNNRHFHAVLFEMIDGESLYKTSPFTLDSNLFLPIITQAARINLLPINPEFLYDSWSITNFLSEYNQNKQYLDQKEIACLEKAVSSFNTINFDTLPKCFVHGDLIKPNILRSNNDLIHIIDFSVSGYYPRIQELAVLMSNCFFDQDFATYQDYFDRMLEIYQSYIKLEECEINTLADYINVAHGIHYLLPLIEQKIRNNDTKENQYWLEQGLLGLSHPRLQT